MKFTVLGGTGFIGRNLTQYLQAQGFEVDTPARDVETLKGSNLGHVIYTIGMTGNHRQNPQGAVNAHVNKLYSLLDGADFESWLYTSSTRIYSFLPQSVDAIESAPVPVVPSRDAIFDLTKLVGEAVCLGHENPNVRAVRLSNVYGAGQSLNTFLGAVMNEAVTTGQVTIGESAQSSKDYVSIDDVVSLLPQIATKGQERLYNVASGRIITHADIAGVMEAAGYKVLFREGGATRAFPRIDVKKAEAEFNFTSRSLIDDLPQLLKDVQNNAAS